MITGRVSTTGTGSNNARIRGASPCSVSHKEKAPRRERRGKFLFFTKEVTVKQVTGDRDFSYCLDLDLFIVVFVVLLASESCF